MVFVHTNVYLQVQKNAPRCHKTIPNYPKYSKKFDYLIPLPLCGRHKRMIPNMLLLIICVLCLT